MQSQPSCTSRHLYPTSQRGTVLVVSLLLLLVLTILGVSAMQSTSLEENMAYATRDRNVALQAAEAALRAGETYVETITSPSAFTGTNGLYRRADTEPNYQSATTWSSTANHVAVTPPTGSTNAQYYIKETGIITGIQGAMNMNGYGDNKGSGDITTIRITARGTGGRSDGAEVVLRSNYGRIF